ncbi:MAG: CPBP family intramembrane metalloprotease [Candidatus Bathyarchaeota archaeon]|nr:CPBP family intramembrane metalloprotease [Candidatus Bathyarchaeota archaeon]
MVTPVVVVSAVSLQEFIKNSIYYIYTYGLVLWSVYHVFLAWLALRFFKAEKQNVGEIVGPIKGGLWLGILTVAVLLGLSFILFQIVEPYVTDLIYGPDMWKQFLSEYKRVPLALAVYGIAVTSLTAGVCEEIVWRGYLQTRFERLLLGKILAAVLLQAVLFGFWHSISVHTLFTAVFGFVYGLVYAKTKRLVPVMVSHWLGDVVGFSVMYFL